MHRRSILMGSAALAVPTIARAANVEVTVLYSQPGLYKEAHETIVREFAKREPSITVRLLAPTRAYEEAASAVLRGAVTNSIPDVVYNGTNLLHLFVDRRLAVPLDPYIAADEGFARDGYIPAMLSTGHLGGHQYAVPFALSTPITFYNEQLVRRAGLDPDAPPADWPGMLDWAQRITALGAPAKGIDIKWQTTGNYLFQALLFSHGGKLLSEDGKRVGFDSPEGLRSFQLLREMVTRGGMADATAEQAMQDFIAGNIGMHLTSSANLNTLMAQIGERYTLRTAPFPVPNPDARIVSGGAAATLFSRTEDKRQAAYKYIRFATGPIGQTIMVNHIGYLPCSRVAIETPELLGNYYARDRNTRTSLSQLPRATGWLGFPGPNSLKAIDAVYAAMEATVAGRSTPEQALARSVEQVNALLPR
ncbi:ABC transporter substrate-binding protein [Rhodovarius crocodyli]|uniref:ABC transporter substrate-binding protein n=1 Tax=Rhodovarius crocodyli TaxID=1979269 RepID=A0A437M2R2_9PROT|nr:ABC transporter substrate-binding protein [Rhodovarius crocodyli]RVT91999.1 ABC transporter substrate-binding protein [Rhodovarius crocodyli]